MRGKEGTDYVCVLPDELLARAREGDTIALEELVNTCYMRVFAVALRLMRTREDAEDATQDAFMAAVQNIHRFRGEASFFTWVCQILTHLGWKVLRKNNARHMVPLDRLSDDRMNCAPPDCSPAQVIERGETQMFLESAISQLDDKYRDVFVLRDRDDHTIAQIACLTGLTQSAVKVRLLRARQQLRAMLAVQSNCASRASPPSRTEPAKPGRRI